MGKKKVAVLGSENEEELKAKKAVKLEQKKIREGKQKNPVGTPVVPEPEKPVVKEKKEHVRSKNYLATKKKVEPGKAYSLAEAFKLLKEVSLAKFDPTVEIHITLIEKGINKEVELPHAVHKSKKIAIANNETLAKIEK